MAVAAMAVLILQVAVACAAAPEVQVGTLDGRTLTGSAVSISTEGVVLQTPDGEVTVSGAELHMLTPKIEPAINPAKADAKPIAAWVDLTDGTRLSAGSFETSKGKAQLTTIDGVAIEISAKSIRSVRFSKLDDPTAELGKTDAAADLLGIRKKDNIDFLEGVIGDVTKEVVNFQLEGETVPVNRAKVDSLVYFQRAADDGAVAGCMIEDAQGSLLKAKTVSLKDGQLQIVLAGGSTLTRPFDSIKKIDFSSGKLIYLSDLKAETTVFTPYFDLGKQSPALARFFEPRRDRGREDEKLRLAGKSYKKGLSLTSRTELVFKVPTKAKRFKALAGIDDGVRPQGSVQLDITADGKKLYSGKLSGKDSPVELDLDLTNMRRLTVLVDYGDDLDFGDHLNLCDARIVK